MKNTKPFYITTSIAYVNAAPHIGYAMELLEADVIARFHRLRGEEVFFLTGTDEHGKKIAEAAVKAGMEPRAYVDSMSLRFIALCKKLGISYDNFIRTSDAKKHIPTVEAIWKQMEKNGDIYKAQYEGRYCTGCEAFLREAEIDEEGKCRIHKKEPELVREENHFFKFSKYAARVEEAIRSGEIQIFPDFRKKEILNFFSDEGVKDFSVSRPKESVGWGIPVPGDDGQTVYVWIDALMNYVSGISDTVEDMLKFPADVHVIGKDIMRFHTMMLPAFLLSLHAALPKSIAIHGFILVEGQKMSKSLGNVIDPMTVIEECGVEPVRYYLLREIPSDGDGDFSIARFKERYAADLQKGLGNLISRVATLGSGNPDAVQGIMVNGGAIRTHDAYKEYTSAIDAFQLHRALEHVWGAVERSNKMVEDAKLWELAKQDAEKARDVFAALAQNLAAIAYMLTPFLPETAEKAGNAIGVKIDDLSGDADVRVRFEKPAQPLFPPLGTR